MNRDSYQAMLDAVQAFHHKHDFKNTGGEELRVAYEELIQLSTADRADRSQYSMEIIEANPQVLSDVFYLASEPE